MHVFTEVPRQRKLRNAPNFALHKCNTVMVVYPGMQRWCRVDISHSFYMVPKDSKSVQEQSLLNLSGKHVFSCCTWNCYIGNVPENRVTLRRSAYSLLGVDDSITQTDAKYSRGEE